MPVTSPRRYSTSATVNSSYLPPSVGGTTSSSINNTVGGTSSVLERLNSKYSGGSYGSSYRSTSLNNSTYGSGSSSSSSSGYNSYITRPTSTYRSSLYSSSSSLSGGTSSSITSGHYSSNYRPTSLYGNNDTTSTNRFGVSNNNSNLRYLRSNSDSRDTASSTLLSSSSFSKNNRLSRISSLLQPNKIINHDDTIINNTLLSDTIIKRNSLHKKPPRIGGSSSNSSIGGGSSSLTNCNHVNNNNINNNNNNNSTKILNPSLYTPTTSYATLKQKIQFDNINNDDNLNKILLKKSSSDQGLINKSDNNINDKILNENNNINNEQEKDNTTTSTTKKSKSISSSSSSSLALQVATSGLDLYEKYSPAHYIPKCELSRSRSLCEGTPSTTTTTNNNNINNDKKLKIKIKHNSTENDNNNLDNNCNDITKTITIRRQRSDNNIKNDANDEKDDDNLINNKKLNNNHKNTNDTTTLSTSPSSSSKLDISASQLANKVRSTTIRSTIPSSPTPSRYYDRDSSRTRNNDNNDDYNSSSSSGKNNSSTDEKSGTEGLCGLRNIGNTCFMNSVIQCLSHTRELTKFLKTQSHMKTGSKDQQILYEFVKLIREMWTPNVTSVTPLELKSAFSSKHRMYSGYNQQDAQEFLRFFLDSLHSALNTGSKGDVLKIDDTLSDNKIADLTWDWYSKIENSMVRDLFVGQLKSSLKCTTCGNTSVTFDPFWDLSVPLPSSSRCKLDACLDSFIREEVLDGDEMPTCSKCRTRRKCTKTFTIQRFPKYLVIHLKRFSETRWSKLSNLVEFPTGERELNMAPYAANSNTNYYYSLYGISNHMGSTAGGHYVALCKHPITKKWHEFNDNIVSDDLSESVLVSSSAYLLFYERAN